MAWPQIWSLASWSALLSRLCGTISRLDSRTPCCGRLCPRGVGFGGDPELWFHLPPSEENCSFLDLQLQALPGRDKDGPERREFPRVSLVWGDRPLHRCRNTQVSEAVLRGARLTKPLPRSNFVFSVLQSFS